MNVNILKLNDPGYPVILKTLNDPPKMLYWTGAAPDSWLSRPRVAIVGSRKASAYGQSVTQKLGMELVRIGVVIISGLALGIDSIAHRGALEAGGTTVAVLPTPLDTIYPPSHNQLARQIVQRGGTLISEYSSGSISFKANFIARNRIVSGLADILLITEAAAKSGSLHTARFALEQGKTVMAVPGNITSLGSEGCNNLIKSGAQPVTDVEDVIFALGLKLAKTKPNQHFHGSPQEKTLLNLIADGQRNQDELAASAGLEPAELNHALTMLEISGYIRPGGGGHWLLR